jgi:hypothetical protein
LADLKACQSNLTFEPDFVTYNYDGASYHDKNIVAWSTNLLSAYKDTQFMDGGNERVFTVGTSQADNLAHAYTYFTHFRTQDGNAGSDTAKINFQYGHRTPSTCNSTWCVFADATHRVPATGWFPIPASHSYTP